MPDSHQLKDSYADGVCNVKILKFLVFVAQSGLESKNVYSSTLFIYLWSSTKADLFITELNFEVTENKLHYI